MSEKIKVLIRMLNDSYEANRDVKTIVFVKDRSVAVYLKKILVGEEKKGSKRDG